MVKTTLHADEWRVIKGIGKMRFAENRRAGVGNLKVRADLTNDPVQFEADTLAAEFVVAKALNIYPDLTFHPRKGGADLTISGKKIDVKHSKPMNNNLCTSVLKNEQSADIYILVLGEAPDNLFIAGWCWSWQFINPANLRKGERGATDYYLYPRGKLYAMSTLAGALESK
jgi:hypothetical protein